MVFSRMNAYFAEVSYAKLGFMGSTSEWIRLNRTMVYYGGGDFDVERKSELVRDAVKAGSSSVLYEDGLKLLIVHAGDDQAATGKSNDIWSFADIGDGRVATPQGVFVMSVAVVAETDPLGVFAHETTHMLGLPDLYATGGQSELVGRWDLMATGAWTDLGRQPSHLSSWSKIRLGWITPSEVRGISFGETASVQLTPLETSGGGYKVVKLDVSSTSYYLVEGREKVGFDAALPSFGVLLLKVNNSTFGYGTVRVVSPSGSLTSATLPVGGLYSNATEQFNLSVLSASSLGYQVAISFGPSTVVIRIQGPLPGLNVQIGAAVFVADSLGNLQVRIPPGEYLISLPESVNLSGRERRVFDGWSDGNKSNVRKMRVLADTALDVFYRLQYLLQVASAYGQVTGAGWQDAGSLAELVVAAPILDLGNGTRRVFTGWSGDLTALAPSTSVLMNTPYAVEARWKTQFQLVVNSAQGTVSGGGWYDAGTPVVFSTAPVVASVNGERFVFDGWTGDFVGAEASGTITMTAPKTVSAGWKTQHLVSLAFVDANGVSLKADPDLVLLTIGDRGPIELTTYLEQWLDQGWWDVQAVRWHGVETAPRGFRLLTAPNGVVTIPVAVYALSVRVHGVVVPVPLVTEVWTTFKDGTRVSVYTRADGVAVFDQLPASDYEIEVGGFNLPARRHVDLVGNLSVSMPVFSYLDAGAVLLPLLLAVLALRRSFRKSVVH